MSVFYQALKISEQTSNFRVLARSFLGIGDIYFERKYFEKALEYYEKSSKVCREHDFLRGWAYAEQSIGDCYAEQKKIQ
jgi:tetratricopeptide (TPR) repeat protein